MPVTMIELFRLAVRPVEASDRVSVTACQDRRLAMRSMRSMRGGIIFG
jgi:hypothetical protein